MKIIKALSHITVVLAVMFVVFFCIDRVNPSMEFISSETSKWVLLLFAVVALAQAVLSLMSIRVKEYKIARSRGVSDDIRAAKPRQRVISSRQQPMEETPQSAEPIEFEPPEERELTQEEADAIAEVEALAWRSIAAIGEFGEDETEGESEEEMLSKNTIISPDEKNADGGTIGADA